MILKEHKKHSFLTKPSYGNFSRNEWAIMGASDHIIDELAATVIKELSPHYRCAYAGGHNDKSVIAQTVAAHAVLEYQNKGNAHWFRYNKPFNRFGLRQMFAAADMVIVNGNTHQAKAQVIVIDTGTEKFLQEALSLLTNVQLILLSENEEDVFDFIKQAIPNWKELPIYRIAEVSRIAAFFKSKLKEEVPAVNGLVLAGGKSTRMGSDKGSMVWHGKEQRYHMAELLQRVCSNVFISCQPGQIGIDSNYKIIEDSFLELGPYGAILSAFREQPDRAWLVTACDMPLLDAATIQYLTEQRDPSSMATTFENPIAGFPEPLITIWEPKSYPILLAMLSHGYSCPRKALESNDICLLKAQNPDVLMNVNTPEEREKAKNVLHEASNNSRLS